MLETVDLRSAAPDGSAVDIIDQVVDSLDTSRFEARYNLESAQGQNPIHPKTLLKVCLLAICNGRFTPWDTLSNGVYHPQNGRGHQV